MNFSEYLKTVQIPQHTFFNVGRVCFFLLVLLNSFILYEQFINLSTAQIASSIIMIIFNGALAMLFNGLYYAVKPMNDAEYKQIIDEVFDEFPELQH